MTVSSGTIACLLFHGTRPAKSLSLNTPPVHGRGLRKAVTRTAALGVTPLHAAARVQARVFGRAVRG